jgi:hypothetical protein
MSDFDDDAPTRVDSGPLAVYEFIHDAETPVREARCAWCGRECVIGELVTPLPVKCYRPTVDPNAAPWEWCSLPGSRMVIRHPDR